ncbi:PAS domain-containing sensor histidine kinase [Pedobacter petrophilus]|uniref:histidine kinase n=1 Tax=Pedobacter petrophilus TaxID=1908241 RepID=A0A7K0FW41_9SPHI|nr:HAMP domain-containing sensor histidine kinase [Pedobacter petrophilus]MRX75641.1 PAS domain-containing sensor histidine kinase [Pedobacter petrophilus]
MESKLSLLNRFIEEDTLLYFAIDLNQECIVEHNNAFATFFNEIDFNSDHQNIVALVFPEDIGYLQAAYQDLQPGVMSDNIEFRMVLQQRTYHLLANVLIDKDDPNILSGRVTDITEKKIYIEKLMEYTNKKNAVLNIVSHDLAGPLGSIQMLSSLLKKHLKENTEERITKIIDMIEANSKRGIKMIQEFIKKEFLESIGVELLKKRRNLVEKIEQLLDEYKSSELHLDLTFVFKCALPEVYVFIDEVKFMQAVNNLISNAIKFTPDHGTITICLQVTENIVQLSIEDTGIGIPEKFHEKLFDKFNLAGRTGLRGEHSVGLGMSIIKTIVEWHEGKIWFESEENKGTTFFIALNEGLAPSQQSSSLQKTENE